MVEWHILNKEHNRQFDMRDTVQIWPSQNHTISFSVISTPGEVRHELWMTVLEARDFANYLLQACHKVEKIEDARKVRSINQSKGRWR